MSATPLVTDILLAIIVAGLLVIAISGVATLALIAALVLAMCGISILLDRRRGRSSRSRRRRTR